MDKNKSTVGLKADSGTGRKTWQCHPPLKKVIGLSKQTHYWDYLKL
jgi:hypothetical protein